MPAQLQAPIDQSAYGRPVAEAARRIGIHPASMTRWLVRGYMLRDGRRIRPDGRRLPGGWRVSDEAVDQFVEAVTRDRTGTPARAAVTSARVEAALDAAGF